ncbi:hypothetical protein STCU_10858 [Strigomonas culicis]|uniref:Uncharacterized protein n=1 Tax=Strigomonas culicis TaxID=28005 RepID=S9TJL6_9TRYP|nr:hypothetical protein STCU_10858 [Strigomonas culicis]|eukprot:EPY17024.1 hypothetical protein STCU_10858 [Strigomonas culicis]
MLVDKVAMSDEQRKKFDVIEVGDPSPQVIKRKDMADERRDDKERDKGDKFVVGGNRRSGPRDNVPDNKRGNTMSMNERFAPPPRAVRGGGNRNHETFEEGVKYELAQNAAHRKQLNDTIAMESGKAGAAAERAEALSAHRKEDTHKSEELDNLMAGMETDRVANAGRSRFFDTASAAHPVSSPPATGSSGAGNLRTEWKAADSSIWRDTRPARSRPSAARRSPPSPPRG